MRRMLQRNSLLRPWGMPFHLKLKKVCLRKTTYEYMCIMHEFIWHSDKLNLWFRTDLFLKTVNETLNRSSYSQVGCKKAGYRTYIIPKYLVKWSRNRAKQRTKTERKLASNPEAESWWRRRRDACKIPWSVFTFLFCLTWRFVSLIWPHIQTFFMQSGKKPSRDWFLLIAKNLHQCRLISLFIDSSVFIWKHILHHCDGGPMLWPRDQKVVTSLHHYQIMLFSFNFS